MLVLDLSGKKKPWKLTGHLSTNQKYIDRPRSELHVTARKLLAELFPTLQILEEVPIHIDNNITLYLDFYLPLLQTAVEVHGQQHYAFNSFYHSKKWDFIIQKQNDKIKKQWCDLNNIDLIILPYNEKIDEWKQRFTDTEDE